MDIGRALPADVSRDILDDLIASKALVEAFALASFEGMIQLDAGRRIARFNRAAEQILGYSAHGVIGSDFGALLHESNAADIFPIGHDPAAALLALRDSRGNAVPVNARCIAVMRADRAEGWILVFHPKQRVEEIEQLKNELVSTVSHELKTPLAAIKAYTATLRQNPILYESHRDEFLGVVEAQADRLSRLVEDMLLVARVESTHLLRKRVMLDVDSLIDDVLSEINVNPRMHPIQRRCAGARVSGDPDRLRDILRNLLENAVKYSPEGGAIEISADENAQRTIIAVRDRGRGIGEEDLPFIFDRFFRAQDDGTAGVGGSGLGLYIVQALVRAHGGSIDVRSSLRLGTTFTLTLPVRA